MAEVLANARERDEERLETLRLEKLAARRNKISSITPFFGLAAIVVLFTVVTSGNFMTTSNLSNLVNQCFNLAIISVGISFVYAHGSMDMSIGSVIALASLAGASFWKMDGVPAIVGILVSIAVAMLCALVISGVHVIARVPVFVASLCVKYICTGIVTTVVAQGDVFVNYENFKFMNNWGLKVFVLLAVIGIGYFVFEYTRIGKDLKAVGGNKTMAGQNGIKVGKSIIIAFLLHGALVGLISMFSLARVGVVSASTGAGTEFDVMTAIVLGGFPIQGGSRAKIRSAIIGAVTVAVLGNGLTLWGVDPYLIYGIKGLLFLLIVGISYERRKGEVVT